MAGNRAKKNTSAPASSKQVPKAVRCAVYTRKSTDEGLQQEFNSLDAQREAAEAFITSQKHEGWELISDHFDDGGYTGGNMDRPALSRLIAAIEAKQVDCVVVYKVDRLSLSKERWVAGVSGSSRIRKLAQASGVAHSDL
jgi:site-specific DNA recombinase